MIYIFRKEMKKWIPVLWVVFASLAIGSGISLVFWRSPHDAKIGRVNGARIGVEHYRRALSELQMYLGMLRPQARLYGISEEVLLKSIIGVGSIEEAAFQSCVKEKLLDQIKNDFKITMDDKLFKEELIKSMPVGILDENGKVNMDAYQQHLSRLSMTPADFEQSKEEELSRRIVTKFAGNSAYVPGYLINEVFDKKYVRKRYHVATFSFDKSLKEVEAQGVEEKTLKEFFEKNKEMYRLPEKKKAKLWDISVEDYAAKMVVDEQTVQQYYEKNKGSLFRIAPKVKVRHIAFYVPSHAAAKERDAAQQKAQEVAQEAKSKPEHFGQFAKKYSQDDVSAKNGGITDFFAKGTFDSEFEKAAFRLQNAGEISEVVKTAKGYEIIQLVERAAAVEKSLESVRDEITKTIKGKRAVSALKGDLEMLMHQARSEEGAVSKFADENKLAAHETDWITQANGMGVKQENILAQKLFGTQKRTQSYGYFSHEGKYVLYMVTAMQKSEIPSFDVVHEQVVKDFKKLEAERLIKQQVTAAKAEFFNKKIAFEDIIQKYQLKHFTTSFVAKGEKVTGIDDKNPLIDKMPLLTDASQILTQHHNDDYFLVQLVEVQPVDLAKFEEERQKIVSREKYKTSGQQLNAFIASLQRNARIEFDKSIVSKQSQM